MEFFLNFEKIRVGLFFGSFDPIHVGHLKIGTTLLENSFCDNIWFIVSPNNPLKDNSSSDFFNRIHMTSTAIKDWDESNFSVSTIESSLTPPFYTKNTLEHIKNLHPEIEFSIIIGEDNLFLLEKWYNPMWIIERFSILVYKRNIPEKLSTPPDSFIEIAKAQGEINWVPGEEITISSKMIREGFFKKDTKSISNLVTKNVFNFITKNNLYDLS